MIFDLAMVLSVVEVVGWTLLHFLWQGALIGVMFAAVRLLFEAAKLSANARYLLGLVCLALLALAPTLTFYYLWSASAQTGAGAVLVLGADPLGVSAVPGTSSWSFTAALEAMLPWLVLTWAAGVLLLSTRVLFSWQQARRMTQDRIVDLSQVLQQRTVDLIEKFEIKRRVQVFESALVQVPTVIGWLKPVVLLPTSAILGLTPTQLELVIAHELGHVRRFDYLINLFQVALETLLFYHPAVRWISRDVRVARELCCDDLVVSRCGQVTEYAKALASLELMRGEVVLPGLAATDGPLLKRIERVLRKPSTGATEVVPVPGHGIALGTLILVAVAGVQGFNSQSVAAVQTLEPPTMEPWSAPAEPVGSLPDTLPSSPLLELDAVPVAVDTGVLVSSEPTPAPDAELQAHIVLKMQATPKLGTPQPPKIKSADPVPTALHAVAQAPKAVIALKQKSPESKLVEPKPVEQRPTKQESAVAESSQSVKVAQQVAPAQLEQVKQEATQQSEIHAPPRPLMAKEITATETPGAQNASDLAAKPAAPSSGQLNPPVAKRLQLAKIDEPQFETKPVLKPVPIYKEPVRYPGRAQRRGQQGYVLIEYSINSNGKVSNFEVLESSPRRVFVQAASKALRGWRFDPADGRRFAGNRYQQKFNFNLGPRERCTVTIGSRICQENP